jgi:hypothetical protein
MPLPQSAIDARARRDARRQAQADRMQGSGKKITASRYGGAQRDTDTIAPDGTNLTMKESPLDAYQRMNREAGMDRTMQAEMRRNKRMESRASSMNKSPWQNAA